MEAAAEKIVADMRSLAPSRSGALRKSIGWTWGEPPKGSAVVATLKANRGGRRQRRPSRAGSGPMTLTIYAGNTTAFYARWIEFGTRSHIAGGQFSGATHPGTSAQPFFFPALRANKRRFMAEVRKAIVVAIREAIR
jgi:HK97 gp10 family phage protein